MTTTNRCPHCGHSGNLHSGLAATASAPGTCHAGNAGDPPCNCPGWVPTRHLRIVAMSAHRGRPGSGYVSPMDESVEWGGDDAA